MGANACALQLVPTEQPLAGQTVGAAGAGSARRLLVCSGGDDQAVTLGTVWLGQSGEVQLIAMFPISLVLMLNYSFNYCRCIAMKSEG